MGSEDSAAGLIERTTAEAKTATARPEQSVPVGADAGIMAIMSTTRAMRHLAPDPVPEGLLRSVIEAATWAPSAGNWQMASYVVVTDRKVMTRLAVLWRRVVEDWRLYLEGAGIVGSGSSAATTRASIDYQLDHFAETPALIVVCGDLRGKAGETRSTAATVGFLVRRVGLRRTLALARGLLRMSGSIRGCLRLSGGGEPAPCDPRPRPSGLPDHMASPRRGRVQGGPWHPEGREDVGRDPHRVAAPPLRAGPATTSG